MTPPAVYLDANVFIVGLETTGSESDGVWSVFRAGEENAIRLVTSELTLAEVLVLPLRLGRRDLVDRHREIITDGRDLRVLPVDREVLIAAASLRSKAPALRLPDAIHLASARRSGCQFFFSTDKRIPEQDGLSRMASAAELLERLAKDARLG